MEINTIRNDFPTLEKLTYLDTAFVGLFPTFVREGYIEFLDEWMSYSLGKSKTTADKQLDKAEAKSILGRWMDKAEETRAMAAEFLGASSDEVAFTQSTGCGLNMPVNGVTWKKGDNVVFPDSEHNPLVTATLTREGVEARIVKSVDGRVELNDLEKAVDDNTKIVQVSQVGYLNGFRLDLKAVSDIAHEHGALVSVDSTQALGALKTDVRKEDVDFLSAGTYKYLIGPAGLGFFYVKSEHIESVLPDRTGWKNQMWRMRPYELPKNARRFEYGTLNFQGIYAFKNSLIYLNKMGILNIERRVLELSSYLWSRLNDFGARLFTPLDTKSPIVSFFVKDEQEIGEKLMREKIKVTARDSPEGHLRVSPHFYNTKEDVDFFMDKLKGIIGNKSEYYLK